MLFSMSVALVMLASLLLSGCPSAVRWGDEPVRKTRTATKKPLAAPGTHVVRQGESLYAIALRYDLSAPDLARWNQLGSGELIFPGQTLRLRAPETTAASTSGSSASTTKKPPPGPKVAAPSFAWPASGSVLRAFGSASGTTKGIDIQGKAGDPVKASGAGRIVYSGDGLIGYGNLIIVKHNDRFLSAYGYNRSLLVKEGDQVTRGQTIARMGLGPDRKATLHFEIRDQGQPVDPQRFLPSR